jgi:hypothetical protein
MMNGFDGSWDPGFPAVMHFVDLESACAKPWKFIEAHPDYEAAKHNEDRTAAMRLVHDFLKLPENHIQLLKLKKQYQNSVLVPIRAIEADGKNKIPIILAEYISHNTGFDVDISIVQINRVNRTGTNEWHRFAFRPYYDGEVKAGRNYILVDDVFSLGGSFNELRIFIEKNGGKVVQMIALATGRSGHEISPRPETLKNLIDKYGSETLSLFLKEVNLYDGSIKAITEPEARALRRAASLDEARDRIFMARRQGNTRMGAENSRKDEYQTAPIDPLELHHRRKLHR